MSSDVRFYLTVYGSIALANTVFTALRAFLFAYGAICAATAIHNRLLDRVLKVRHLSFEAPKQLDSKSRAEQIECLARLAAVAEGYKTRLVIEMLPENSD